jgi:bacterioferritin-associated ferredoxin
MIVCSCNVLSDEDVLKAATTCSGSSPRNAKQLYGCLGCNAECGRCAGTIKEILQKAVSSRAPA